MKALAVGFLVVFCLAVVSAPTFGAGTDPLVEEAVGKKAFVIAEFVSASCPACEEMAPVVQAVLAKYPAVLHQVHDADREPDLSKKYEVKCVPVYVVLDPQGRVRFNEVGMRTEQELEQILREAGVGSR